jgi:hypothetical protein
VNPVARTSHLKVADEGIALLNSIDGPVSPIVVIGPYRSGKSFLLNQLLGVPCSELTQLQQQQLVAAAAQISSGQRCITTAAGLLDLYRDWRAHGSLILTKAP